MSFPPLNCGCNTTDEVRSPSMLYGVPGAVGCPVLLQDRGVSNEGGRSLYGSNSGMIRRPIRFRRVGVDR
jgi:hypothetical protein